MAHQTVWQRLSGRNRDLMMARPGMMALIATIYGGFRFADLGFSADHYLTTYVPFIGGLASLAAIMWFSATVGRDERGAFDFVGSLSGFVPYAFATYLIVYLGGYRAWSSLSPVDWWGLAIAVLWVLCGYRLLRGFWIITELATLDADREDLSTILFSKLGMSARELQPVIEQARSEPNGGS